MRRESGEPEQEADHEVGPRCRPHVHADGTDQCRHAERPEDDADRAAERVKQLGGAIVVEPMEVPGGDRIAVCTDPQGGFFAVHSRKAG